MYLRYCFTKSVKEMLNFSSLGNYYEKQFCRIVVVNTIITMNKIYFSINTSAQVIAKIYLQYRSKVTTRKLIPSVEVSIACGIDILRSNHVNQHSRDDFCLSLELRLKFVRKFGHYCLRSKLVIICTSLGHVSILKFVWPSMYMLILLLAMSPLFENRPNCTLKKFPRVLSRGNLQIGAQSVFIGYEVADWVYIV